MIIHLDYFSGALWVSVYLKVALDKLQRAMNSQENDHWNLERYSMTNAIKESHWVPSAQRINLT